MADTCSPMLKLFLEMYLPALKAWSWSSIKLGVRNKKFGLAIKSTTGITCRRKHHFLKELRGGIEQFLHLFLEIEVSACPTLYFLVYLSFVVILDFSLVLIISIVANRT